jgi:hypothetical protein
MATVVAGVQGLVPVLLDDVPLPLEVRRLVHRPTVGRVAAAGCALDVAPTKTMCTSAIRSGRQLSLRPRPVHEALQQVRVEGDHRPVAQRLQDPGRGRGHHGPRQPTSLASTAPATLGLPNRWNYLIPTPGEFRDCPQVHGIEPCDRLDRQRSTRISRHSDNIVSTIPEMTRARAAASTPATRI